MTKPAKEKVVHGLVSGSQPRGFRLDTETQALLCVDYAHHEVHAGSSFEYTNALDFTNAEEKSFCLCTANTKKWPHFFFIVNGQAEFNIDFYEDATPDADGVIVTAPAVINRDRNSLKTNGLLIYGGPTLGGGSKGTLIRRHHAGSGKASGGDSRSSGEIILKQNTKYWTDIKNETTSNNFIAWHLVWYEHTNRR